MLPCEAKLPGLRRRSCWVELRTTWPSPGPRKMAWLQMRKNAAAIPPRVKASGRRQGLPVHDHQADEKEAEDGGGERPRIWRRTTTLPPYTGAMASGRTRFLRTGRSRSRTRGRLPVRPRDTATRSRRCSPGSVRGGASQLSMGKLSYQRIVRPQVVQRERGLTTLSPRGSRAMQTLRKLPKRRPTKKTAASIRMKEMVTSPVCLRGRLQASHR